MSIEQYEQSTKKILKALPHLAIALEEHDHHCGQTPGGHNTTAVAELDNILAGVHELITRARTRPTRVANPAPRAGNTRGITGFVAVLMKGLSPDTQARIVNELLSADANPHLNDQEAAVGEVIFDLMTERNPDLVAAAQNLS